MPVSNIPIVTIGYNNLYWIRHFVQQIQRFSSRIIIIDNNSTAPDLLKYYQNEFQHELWQMDYNYGHQVYHKVWSQFPSKFILSDPDLEMNPRLPSNFIQSLSSWSDHYKLFKIGMALDISEPNKMFQCSYVEGRTIVQWESQYWTKPVPGAPVEMYFGAIDTTFCLINKKYAPFDFGFNGTNIVRVAGDFTCKHLPWYPEVLRKIDPSQSGLFGHHSTGTVTQMLKNSRSIQKHQQRLQIPTCLKDFNWWINCYPSWNPDLFSKVAEILDPGKVFVDLDPQQGQVAIFAMAGSRRVICLETDPQRIFDLKVINVCSSSNNLEVGTETSILELDSDQVAGVRLGAHTSSSLAAWAINLPKISSMLN